MKKLILQKQTLNQKNSNSMLLDKKKLKLIRKNNKTTLQIKEVKKQLKEYQEVADTTNREMDKIVSQYDHFNEKIDNIKNQITVYSSLG